MTYVNAIKYLNAHTGGTPSPERMRLLCRYLGDPQRNMKFVHIAGGRGKTSCSFMLSVILAESGITVGSLISSHIEEHRERIRIKNEPLTHKDFAEYVHRVSLAAAKMKADIDLAAELSSSEQPSADVSVQHKITKNLLDGKIAPDPTEEEIICAAALIAFVDKGCGISLLECGESRADPTGVIEPPLVSFICGGSLDQEQLRTACGTIRRGTREVVCSAMGKESYNTISSACAKTGSRMTVPAHGELALNDTGLRGMSFEYRGKTYTVPFCANYHMANALTSIEAIYALRRNGIALHSADVVRGIAKARIPLRFDFVSISPTIVIDCARTESDLSVLCESLFAFKESIGERIVPVLDNDSNVARLRHELENRNFKCAEPVILSGKGVTKQLSAALSAIGDGDILLVTGSPEFSGKTKKEIQRILACVI